MFHYTWTWIIYLPYNLSCSNQKAIGLEPKQRSFPANWPILILYTLLLNWLLNPGSGNMKLYLKVIPIHVHQLEKKSQSGLHLTINLLEVLFYHFLIAYLGMSSNSSENILYKSRKKRKSYAMRILGGRKFLCPRMSLHTDDRFNLVTILQYTLTILWCPSKISKSMMNTLNCLQHEKLLKYAM